MTYQIIAKGLQGTILTYTVDKYEIVDGFVTFFDKKNGMKKSFHSTNCEIQEVSND